MWYRKVTPMRPVESNPLFQMVEKPPQMYYPSAIERQRIADGTPMTFFSTRNQAGRPEQPALVLGTVSKSCAEETKEEEKVEKSIDANAVIRRYLGR